MDVRAFVQARMSSRRFPGKVLAPLHGEPIIDHVVRRLREAVGGDAVVVATSDLRSDDPLAAYLVSRDVPCFRGPLDDVLHRYVLCADAFPCEWVLRISADSPLIDPAVIAQVLAADRSEADVVTTVFPRTVPHGHAAELVRVTALREADSADATEHDREHVTPYLYRAGRFRVVSVDPAAPPADTVVDTVEDLQRLEETG